MDGEGPLVRVFSNRPIPVRQGTRLLTDDEKALGITGKDIPNYIIPGKNSEEVKKIAIKCRSDKERDRMIHSLQKRFGPRVMTTEQYDQVFGQENMVNNKHFVEYVNEVYYFKENNNFIDNFSANKFNLFQSCNDIRGTVLSSSPEIIPFSIAAHFSGCLSMRLWCENFFTKLPMSNAYPLHCMLPFIGLSNNRGETETRGCTIWVLLDDVSRESGGVCVIKNSHAQMKDKFALIENILAEAHPALSFEFDLWYREYIKQDNEINGTPPTVHYTDLKKGDVLIVNNATLYGISANPSSRPWKALQYHLVPDGSIFAGYRSSWVPRHLLKDAQIGDYLVDEEKFPVVFNAV
eukprot:CAMPEP_0201533602 /NCGR_PEP_ID=MMETSP0161_2-20130828/53733_1 /ASSEMBLY_ACC=CAM_ASM_000251 /TAXON_ID=180227 /ORGANISM="Neoparamoeba aestuarina, Strain SoJaBio B1-5/56/2" /LENGTH=349 /DNA_ID=CAMNT_0047937717 /DNA_START=75 /DNA_END=1124 /DNA_ORIENTATION=+